MTMNLITIVSIVLAIWLFIGIKKIGHVSQGPKIGDRPNSAILLIDLQTVFWESGPYDEESKAKAQSTIEAEVFHAQNAGTPVIAIRQEWSILSTKIIAKLLMKGQAVAGSKGIELAMPFADMANHTLTKRVQDAFETGKLDVLLKQLDVGTLRILGLDGNYCVAKTAQGARQRGFDVAIVTAGVLVGDPTKYKSVLKELNAAGVSQV